MSSRRRSAPRIALGLALVLLGLVAVSTALAYVIAGPRPATFNVTATTEWVRFVSAEAPASGWAIGNARVYLGEAEVPEVSLAESIFRPASCVAVTLERVAFGPAVVRVEPWSGNAQADSSCAGDRLAHRRVGTFFTAAEEFLAHAEGTVEMVLDATALNERLRQGETLVVPLAGEVEVGREVGIETSRVTPLLREGTVRMLGRSLLRGRAFEAGSAVMGPGDRLVFPAVRTGGGALGFSLIDERPAMTAVFRRVASEARVVRPGGGEYRVAVALFDQLRNDPVVGGVSALAAAMVALVSLANGIPRLLRRTRDQPPARPEGGAGDDVA